MMTDRIKSPSSGVARRGLAGSTLKLMAISIMLIDHVGAVILEQGYLLPVMESNPELLVGSPLIIADLVFRMVGRVAFPLFCFLLVEGMAHTSDRRRYALRLGLFCLASEIPFDLAFSRTPFFWNYQNVFFTLLIGFLVLWAMETVGQKSWSQWKKRGVACAALLSGMALAQWMKTDYSAFGVFFIFLFYILHHRPKWQRNVACGAACVWEVSAPLALIPIHFYDGRRGLRLKYIFYVFYPAHLLVLVVIRWLLCGR